jgi:hypothetical protein
VAKSKTAKAKTAQAASRPVKPATNTHGPAKKKVVKERGPVLSFLIILILLHAVFATFLAYSTLKEEYVRSTTWILPVLALVSVADIVAAVGLWYWKKWAIYLYAGTRVVATAIHLMLTGSLLVVFYDLLPVSILGYVINLQSKRDLFD